jgi:AcrR family transcriptional regulator
MVTPKVKTKIRQMQIADAAFDIISKEGPRGFTIAQVAKKAGITPSNVYRHFKNKNAVLGLILDGMTSAVEKMVRESLASGNNPRERLETIFLKHVQLMRERKGIVLFMFQDIVSGEHKDTAMRMKNALIAVYLNTIQMLLMEGIEQGYFHRTIDVRTAATVFLGDVQMTILQWLLLGDAYYPDEKRCKSVWKIYADGILKHA